MTEQTAEPMVQWIDHEAVNRALELATRDALLEHARMGREVHQWRDGKVVAVMPAEIFARYGFDEFGRPLARAAGG